MGNLQLASSAFEDGGEIPRECGYKNGNEKPPLTINGIPEGTKSLALIMDDPDAMEAVGKVWAVQSCLFQTIRLFWNPSKI